MKLVMSKDSIKGVLVFRDPSNRNFEGIYYSVSWRYSYTKNDRFKGYSLGQGSAYSGGYGDDGLWAPNRRGM